MSAERLSYCEIVRLDDDLLLPWLDLYETTFPPAEKVLVSNFLQLLKDKAQGGGTYCHLLAALQDERFVGLGCYEFVADAALGLLWYLAVVPPARGRGIGADIYREMIRRLAAAGARAVFLEVEIPEQLTDATLRSLAERRIAFYRRLGARLLEGIHYLQHVGWHQPDTPMHLMVHPLAEGDPQRVFSMAQAFFGARLSLQGTLKLT